MDDIFTYLAKKYDPSLLCPQCQKAHPRLVLAGTARRHKGGLRWKERCGGIEVIVASRREVSNEKNSYKKA